jgi:hypothetical protein
VRFFGILVIRAVFAAFIVMSNLGQEISLFTANQIRHASSVSALKPFLPSSNNTFDVAQLSRDKLLRHEAAHVTQTNRRRILANLCTSPKFESKIEKRVIGLLQVCSDCASPNRLH